jgi:hypothetical protein
VNQERSSIRLPADRPIAIPICSSPSSPIPFAFVDQPLIVIRTFTIVGSLFIPFLAGTLIYLNNFKIPPASGVPRNSLLTNLVLVLALVLFAVVGAADAGLLR